MRALALCALTLVACGGRVNIAPEQPSDDASSDAAPSSDASTPDDGAVAEDGAIASDATSDAAPPTSMTCDALADAVCGSAKACCETSGLGWDEMGCRNALTGFCGYQINAVDTGLATYDASQLDACIKAWKSEVLSCRVDFLAYVSSHVPCAHLFNGVREPGSKCNPSSLEVLSCRAPDGMLAYCDTKAAKCRAYGVVKEGAACSFTGSNIRYCDRGLYCDAGASGTCKKAKALGEPCASSDDLSCGMFNVCKDGKCAAGLPEGSACSSGNECASYTCTMGKCTTVDQITVDKGVCTGMSG